MLTSTRDLWISRKLHKYIVGVAEEGHDRRRDHYSLILAKGIIGEIRSNMSVVKEESTITVY